MVPHFSWWLRPTNCDRVECYPFHWDLWHKVWIWRENTTKYYSGIHGIGRMSRWSHKWRSPAKETPLTFIKSLDQTLPCVVTTPAHGILGTQSDWICCIGFQGLYNIACVPSTNRFRIVHPRACTILHILDKNTNTSSQFHDYLWHIHRLPCHVVGACHHGMACPQVVDRGTVSDKEGSCE